MQALRRFDRSDTIIMMFHDILLQALYELLHRALE